MSSGWPVEQLHFVMPGETAFTMIDPDESAPRRNEGKAVDRAWYTNLLDGMDHADRAHR